MHKESFRFFALTVSLFGIICMAKDLSEGKESAIKKDIYYINKDLNHKGEFPEQDYVNDYLRKKKFAERDENGFESNVQNASEKSENIIPINNLQSEAAVKTQLSENNRKKTAEKNGYNIKIIKKRKNDQSHSRPGRENPLSYLHINHETKYNEPEIYIFDAKNFNEDVIRRLTRTEKKYELPMCDITEKTEENIHAPSTISSSSLQKRGLSNNNQISIMNFNRELKRKVRSQWRFRDHYYDFATKYNKYNSPVEYNENNNLENINEINTSDLNEKVFFDQVDNNDKHSNNFMIKRGATNEKEQISSNETSMQSNLSNNSIEHDAKNKSQVPIVQSPSIAPLTLPSGVVPNISYVYLQPLPFGNSMLLNQPKPVESSSASSKKSNSAVNTDNKGNDLITISIDPRTLQNKILHAEFLKKSDVKKTPDTLSIELTPKDTVPTNSSKHQKTVQKPLKISASVKNNSIFITGGDSKGYQKNIANEKKPQLNGQTKSISSQINMNDIFDDHKSIHEYNSQNEMNLIDNGKTDETKVLIINAKQKEVCATESPCKLLSTYCSIDLCDNASHCKRSTRNLQNFREVHEIEDKEATSIKENLVGNKTISYNISDDPMVVPTSNPMKYGVKIKRETNQMNISKLIELLKPVIVLSPKKDSEGSEDESGDSEGIINKVNLKGSSEMALEKGNKKVENKILEGFINSIIANYSKDEIKPLMKETTEKSEDGSEALLKLLESNLPKRNERDKESSDEKKSDVWNLKPVLVPESSISKYGDNPEYAKLGPFDENFIKSFLRKGYIL